LEFLVVGLNHRTSPLEVREKLTLTKAQWPGALKTMESYGVPGVILCTCNRSEFYTTEPGANPEQGQNWSDGEDRIKQFLVDQFGVSLLDVDRYLYVHRQNECVRHLFRVASSLDSMILGEEQIIGQVRDAFEVATQASTAQGPLSLLFQRALRVGRKVRRETGIGRNALSVSRACVELARNALGDLRGRSAMVVGAGDAGELAAQVLHRSGVTDITVTNRTYRRAVEVAAGLSGQPIPFHEFPNALQGADIVIGCTGSPGYVLEAGTIQAAMAARPHRPLFLLDIAVPRDIDPTAAEINNVFLHDVDDLESVSEASRQEKEQEARWAEDVVTREIDEFLEWWRDLEVLPTVIALRHKAEDIRERELNKTLKRLDHKLTAEDQASVEAMTRAIVKKLLHAPTIYLKNRPPSNSLEIAKDFFQLSD
jgi:glutamyl-tRNA reductase